MPNFRPPRPGVRPCRLVFWDPDLFILHAQIPIFAVPAYAWVLQGEPLLVDANVPWQQPPALRRPAMTQPELFLRVTVIGGDRLDNDYDVFFEGRRVGRIREATERTGFNPGWA